ncbi:MAG: uracil-DNA glycosylase [Alphaproteobacteria bacterium]|nr:uracil-DNA glycosylase [Alphaproteobacteria bacterium]
MEIKIEASWHEVLKDEFNKPYFLELVAKIKAEKSLNKIIYPSGKDIFKCFELTPFHAVKVVIIGQDPYHNPHQAMGLCFSVAQGVALPPSLKNIFKELHDDLNVPFPKSGDLTPWARQGILLLNSILTVRHHEPASHSGYGWEIFTQTVIEKISSLRSNVVFVLWGNYAIQKKKFIDMNKHVILTAPHPSPLSAYQGFMGCKHFSKINDYLIKINTEPIHWQL